MGLKVLVTRDREHISRVAANIVLGEFARFIPQPGKWYYSVGLPTGSTPVRMYELIAEHQDEFCARCIVSHNLDEYVGLPGKNPVERSNHKESYARFMVRHLFDKLEPEFHRWFVPAASLIDPIQLEEAIGELGSRPTFYDVQGTDKGRAIIIPDNTESSYLKWIKQEILDAYVSSIRKWGGIDLQIVGVGGRGHIGFHESGIPLNLDMLLVKLDDNTVQNAVEDGHFETKAESPKYAVSMGAGLVYNPDLTRAVMLGAYGPRKTGPVAESLLGPLTEAVPISGLQQYAQTRPVLYLLDEIAAKGLEGQHGKLQEKGIVVSDLRGTV